MISSAVTPACSADVLSKETESFNFSYFHFVSGAFFPSKDTTLWFSFPQIAIIFRGQDFEKWVVISIYNPLLKISSVMF